MASSPGSSSGLEQRPQVSRGARGSLRPEDGAARAASLLATHHGSLPRKVSNLSDRFHHNPLSLDHPTTRSGGRGMGWGWGSCWCRALPRLWHRKNTWRVTAWGERGSHVAPPPLRSPSSAQAASSWKPGGCTGIWRGKNGSGARLGELGSRAEEAWAWVPWCALCRLWERALAVPARRSRQ